MFLHLFLEACLLCITHYCLQHLRSLLPHLLPATLFSQLQISFPSPFLPTSFSPSTSTFLYATQEQCSAVSSGYQKVTYMWVCSSYSQVLTCIKYVLIVSKIVSLRIKHMLLNNYFLFISLLYTSGHEAKRKQKMKKEKQKFHHFQAVLLSKFLSLHNLSLGLSDRTNIIHTGGYRRMQTN